MAEQEKHGAIGEAEATREKEIKVAENIAQSDKGKKTAEADRRIFVQQRETAATIGEAEANREKEIKVAENLALGRQRKESGGGRQTYFRPGTGSTGRHRRKQGQGRHCGRRSPVGHQKSHGPATGRSGQTRCHGGNSKAQYRSEQERLNAEEVVKQEIEKRKIEIAAEAEAEKIRREAKGTADAILMKYEADARGIRQVLESKATGYSELVKSCGGDANSAATLLMIEKIEQLVTLQVEAVKNLKIDKITVWDSGNGDKGASSTANFLSGMVKSLPPLHDIAEIAGLDLPKFLGEMQKQEKRPDKKTSPKDPPSLRRQIWF